MRYEGSVYRPPSEAHSLIVQATIGCSHNKCTFCSMYRQKSFRMRKLDEIIEDIDVAALECDSWTRVFLADGDALVMPMQHLVAILDHIQCVLPVCNRVGIYASVQSLRNKTVEELKVLKQKGLGIAYLGIESGSDEILKDINKGANSADMEEAALKLKDAGIAVSVMLISGIGGTKKSEMHAIESARLMQRINPEYLSLLTLMVEPGTPFAKDVQSGSFQLLDGNEVLKETRLFLENLGNTKCIFRANHASNYVNLAGDFPEDRQRLIHAIELALTNGDRLKSEYYRRL